MSKSSRKFSIGRFSISFLRKGILFVFAGQKRIYFKTIRFNSLFAIKSSYIAVIICIIGLVWFYSSPRENMGVRESSKSIEDEINANPALSDNDKKNALLQSAKTDFLTQKEGKALVLHQHKVKKGENLSEIAKKYGVSMDTICGSNKLQSYDLIHEGTVFIIPNKEGILHKMEKGNRIASLAEKYKVSTQKIIDQNDIKNPDFVAVGQTIFIPDARPQNIFPGYLWPVNSMFITGGYGWRRNPYNWNEKEFHQGIDIKASFEQVRATKYGQVTYAGWLGGYGNAIVVSHPNGVKSLYAHLAKIYVRPGQYVKQGQYVGLSGNTGRSTGAHLHFEIIQNGQYRNPYTFLKTAGK